MLEISAIFDPDTSSPSNFVAVHSTFLKIRKNAPHPALLPLSGLQPPKHQLRLGRHRTAPPPPTGAAIGVKSSRKRELSQKPDNFQIRLWTHIVYMTLAAAEGAYRGVQKKSPKKFAFLNFSKLRQFFQNRSIIP